MSSVFHETSRDAAGAAPIDLGGGLPPEDVIRVAPQSAAALATAARDTAGNAAAPLVIVPAPASGTPAERLETALGPLVLRDEVRVRDSRDWLEVEVASELMFARGSAELQTHALPALREIAGVIGELGKPVRIEGHTDSVPLHGGRYASNWHLSAARAATIAEALVAARVPAERLSAVGYGEFRPRADNATDAGRAQNRRVVIAVAKHAAAAEGVSQSPSGNPARTLQRVETLPLPAEIGP
jgi:chemotaxis protein MotB